MTDGHSRNGGAGGSSPAARMVLAVAVAAGCLATAAPATAQTGIRASVEATPDERRRGLSWSEGRASISGEVGADLGGIETSVRVAATRGSVRHSGADAVIDATVGKSFDLGPFRVRGRVIGHFFVDAGRTMDYGELGADGSYSLGPVQVSAAPIRVRSVATICTSTQVPMRAFRGRRSPYRPRSAGPPATATIRCDRHACDRTGTIPTGRSASRMWSGR
jgi:hypothetical protein